MQPIPIKDWISLGLDLVHRHLGFAFNAAASLVTQLDLYIGSGLHHVPPYVVVLIVAGVLAWRTIVAPVLDYMQTTPAFVYLIPSVLFFGIGTAPGVFATVVFALPPLTRNIALGIQEADAKVIEAAEAFGATRAQLLRKVKLPLALPYFVIGINQCVMMSLSMVVMASLIGARGLGTIVVTSLAQVDFPMGIESGLAVVAIAIALDRISRPATVQRLRRRA